MADLQLRIMGEDNASPALNSVSDSTRKLGDSQKEGREAAERYAKALDLGVDALKSAGRAAVQFGIDSVRAFMEAERAQKQLTLVAHGLSGAFRQQADAIADALGLQGELVMGVQTMLLRYGEAPAAVEATTRAILDYAAATGTDAASATEALTRGVESGTGQFKGLGISIEATGNKTKDLALATAALAKKYGGAGAEDAQSLTGQVRGAKEAFGGLQEAFGGFIASVASKTGVLGALTRELRSMTAAMETASKLSPRTLMSMAGEGHVLSKTLGVASGGLLLPSTLFAEYLMRGDSGVQAGAALEMYGLAQGDAFGAAAGRAAIASNGGVNDFSAFEMDLTGRKKGGGSAASATVDSPGFKLRERDFIDPTDAADADFNKAILGSSAYVKDLNQRRLAVADGEASIWKVVSDAADKGAAEAKAKTKQWADAGAAIGNAFANSLSSAIESLASGESLDVGQTVGDILGSLLPALGGILGNLIAPGVGGALGGMLGQLGGAAVRGLGRSGGGVTVNTMDGQSAREFFERDGGRALYNASRTGRGALGNL